MRLIRAWNEFWFEYHNPFGVALFRTIFGIGAALFYLSRLMDFRFVFSDLGIFPKNLLIELIPSHLQSPIPLSLLASNQTICFVFCVVHIALLIALSFGKLPRMGVWVLFLVHLVLIERNPAVVYGADFIATFWLFYLCWIDSNFNLTRKPTARSKLFTSVGLRLIQVQTCIIYAYSGLEKLRGTSWWSGKALWSALVNGQLAIVDFSWLHHFPFLIAALTFFTVLWEIYFPVLIWFKKNQLPLFCFGILLHLGIGMTLGLYFFSWFMIAAYATFLEQLHKKIASNMTQFFRFFNVR